MNEYLSPEGKPAPPRPRRPDALISLIIQSGPLAIMSLVRYQSPYLHIEMYPLECSIDVGISIAIDIGKDSIGVLKVAVETSQPRCSPS